MTPQIFMSAVLVGCAVTLGLTYHAAYGHDIKPYLVMRRAVQLRRQLGPWWLAQRRLTRAITDLRIALAATLPTFARAADAIRQLAKAFGNIKWPPA